MRILTAAPVYLPEQTRIDGVLHLPDLSALTLAPTATVGAVAQKPAMTPIPALAPPETPGASQTRNIAFYPGSMDAPADWSVVRDIELNVAPGPVHLPPGVYGQCALNGASTLVIGRPQDTTPARYHFRKIVLNARSRILVAGPVIVTTAQNVSVNAYSSFGLPLTPPPSPPGGDAAGLADVPSADELAGSLENVDRLELRIAAADRGLSLNGDSVFYGRLLAPDGWLSLNGNSHFVGKTVAAALHMTASRATFPDLPADPDPDPAPATIDAFAAAAIPAPAASITATPSTGIAPLDSTITWTSANASAVSVSGLGLSSADATGTAPVTNLAAGTHTYTITAQPVQSATLTWTTTNAVSLRLTGPGGADMDVTGRTSATVTTAGDWTLTARNAANVTTTRIVTIAWPAAATDSDTITVADGIPVADPQLLAIPRDTPMQIELSGYDPRALGEPVAYVLTSQPSHGTLALDGDGLPGLVYRPAYGFAGTDTFTFRVTSGSGDAARQSAEATITINVADSGAVLAAISQTVTTTENVPVSFVLSGSDSRGLPVTFDVAPLPAGSGTLTGTAPALTYVHSQAGAYALDFTVNATVAGPAPVAGRVTILVLPVNEAPVVDAGPDQSVSGHATALFGNATDDGRPNPPGSLAAQWSLVRGSSGGSAIFTTPDATSTTVTVSKDGTYVFRLTAHDGELQSEDTCEVFFGNPNQPPSVDAGPDQIISFGSNLSENLLVNPGAEDSLNGWTSVNGSWTTRTGSPSAQSGSRYFATSGSNQDSAGLVQVVDVSAYASEIDAGRQIFVFSAWARVKEESTRMDSPRIEIEYRSAGTSSAVLATQVLQLNSTSIAWVLVADSRTAPVGTRSIGVRLVGEWTGSDSYLDVYFDSLSLQAASQDIQLQGTISDDALPSATLSWEWIQIAGPAVEITAPTGSRDNIRPSDTFSADSVVFASAPGNYEFRLNASDGELPSADSVRITITSEAANQPPLVNARLFTDEGKDDITASMNDPVTPLLGSVEDDTLPHGPLVYSWSKVTGEGQVFFSDPFSFDTTATFQQPGRYVLRLTATDGEFISYDDITVWATCGTGNARIATDVMVVLDDSSSMPWSAIENEQTAARQFLEQLEYLYDRGGIVAFGSWARLLQGLTSNYERILSAIDQVGEWEGTNIADALRVAREELTANVREGTTQVIILLSDGGSGRSEAQEQARLAREAGIRIISVALGEYVDEDLMRSVVADEADYFFVRNSDDLPNLYLGLTRAICRGEIARVAVDAGPDIYTSSNTLVDLNGRVDFADVAMGDERGIRWSVVSGPGEVRLISPQYAESNAMFTTPGTYKLALTASAVIAGVLRETSDEITVVVAGGDCAGSSRPDGIVAWWPGDGSGEDIIGGHDVSGDFKYTSGMVNEALNFTDYYAPPATVADTSALALARNGSFSVEAWIKPTSDYAEGYLWRWNNLKASIYHESYYGNYTDFYPTDNYYEGYTWWYSSGWTHVAVIYDKENSLLRTYINGELKIDNAYTLSDDATDGGFRFGDLSGFSIDELALYSRALTAGEVTAIYDLGAVGKCVEGLALPITVSAGDDRIIPFGTTANLRGSVTEGHFVSYRLSTAWTVVSAPEGVGPSAVTFTDAASPVTGARFPAAGDYTLRLTATDPGDPGNPARTVFDEVTITVQPSPNKAPSVFLPEDITITVEDTLAIPAYVTDDDQPLPTPTLLWTLVAGPSGGVVTFSDSAAAETTVSFSKHGVYQLRLTADDGALAAHDDILVTVLPAANKAPVVRLGTAPDIPQNAILTLRALVTDDGLPVGATLTHRWTKISGPGTALFAAPDAAESTVSFSAPGLYILQLAASDGELTGTAQITVNVTASQKTAPAVAFDPPGVTIPSGSPIALPAPQITHDPATDPATLTCRWTRVSGPAITFGNPDAPDTTMTFSGPGTYVLRLTVTDGALAGCADLTVTLQPGPNQAPRVSLGDNTGTPLRLPLYTTLNLEGAFSDDGQPVGCTYRREWTILSTPPGIAPAAVTLAPNPADPQNTLKRQIRFPAEGTYVIQLSITEHLDGADYLTGAATLTVIIGPPENTAPWVSLGDGTDASVTLPRNGILRIPAFVADDGLPAGGVLTAGWETLAAPAGGAVAIKAAPDAIDEFDYALTFSAEGVYKLRLTADDGELTGYDEITVTVTAPGNAAPMVFVGEAISIPLGTPLRATAIVIDDALPLPPPPGGALATAWTVTKTPSGVDPADVTIAPATASVSNNIAQETHAIEATMTFPATGDYTLRLTADDGELTGTATLAVRVTEPDNRAPLVSIAPPPPPPPGGTLTLRGFATDDGLPSDPGALTLAWTILTAPDGGTAPFGTPDAAETTVTLNDIPGDYTLRLTAHDGELTGYADVTLTVTTTPPPSPANQPPAVAVPDAFTVTQGQAINVSGAAADDGLPADPGSLATTWSFTGPASGLAIAEPSALTTLFTFKKAGTYTLTLTATDGELTATASTTVTVLPAENTNPGSGPGANGSLSLSPFYPAGYLQKNSVDLYVESIATDTSNATITVEYILTGPASAPVERRQITHAAPWYWEFRDIEPGAYTLRVIARNASGNEIEATPGSFTVLAPGQTGNELPEGSTLTLPSPPPSADTTEITAPVEITGIVHVPGLAYYALQYRRVGETGAQWTPFATATGSLGDPATSTPAPLGTLDPSLLRNGDYDLRIAAYTSGNTTPAGTSDTARITIDGKRKVGNFAIAFKDLSLPLAGLPVEVTRTYDSRDRHTQGDFGYGWNIALNTLKLTKNRPIGEEWRQDVEGGMLGMSRYTINPSKKHLITLSFPDDSMATFEVTVRGPGGTNSNLGAPIGEVYFNFTPANARTKGTLYFDTEGGAPFKAAVSGYDWSGGTPVQLTEDEGGYDYYDPYDDYGYGYGGSSSLFNPTRFRYTAEDGTIYVIDEHLGLISITDTVGNKLEVIRNGATGRIDQITHSSGQSVLIHRDAQGRVSHITDPYGAEIDYVYDAHGDLVGVANRAAETTTFDYYTTSTDPRDEHLTHFLKDIIDPSGTLVMRTEYDEQGRLIKQTDAHGNPVTFEHDTSAGIEKIKNRLGYVTEHHYDAEGNVTRTINPDGGITDYEFTDTQNPNSVTRQVDPLGRITRYAYDAKGNVTREENHLGHATTTAYNDKGNPTTITDALGRATQNTYTSSGLPTTMTDALGHETKFDAYDSRGNLLRLVDATGRITTSTYDGSDRLLTQTDATGNTTTYAYDSRGNVTTETRRVAKPDLSGVETLVTAYEYDAEDRAIKTTQPDGTVTNTEYNANGKPSRSTDAAGRVTETEYDPTGNVTKTTHHPAPGSGETVTTEETWYDAENHPVLTKDSANHWTRTGYDSMGRVVATWDLGTHATLAEAETAPLSPLPSSASEYDLAGQVTATTDALGNRTTYEYDGAGRRTKVTSPTGQVTRSTYDAAGNLSAVTDAAGNITRHYYDAGNRRTETQFPDGTRTSTIYDELGRRTATIDAEGKTTRYIYDEAGRLAAIFDAAQQATSFAYDDLGRQTAQIDAEGRKTSYTYNTAGQRATRTLPGGQTESYAYNPDGSLASKTDFNGETVTFTYDGFGRLIAQTPSTAVLARGAMKATFTYDAGGRRISQTLTDANNINQWWETYGYDNYGRLAQKRTPAGDLGYLYD
ncbi:MAG: VWA domain-containing protein, partial [Opitutaceae bacterium]|nr:VWA domain-containing protein [Opitutaceae bacterium]